MAGDGVQAWGRVSARDVEVLEFVARFGVVPRDAVAKWSGTARTMTARREKRLRDAGLVEVAKPLAGEPFLLATRAGLDLCGRGELLPARIALVRLAHFAAVARLAVRLEAEGRELLSERELAAHERALGERTFSARLEDDSHHRPDLILCGSPPAAIEVELTQKGGPRLDRIVTAWAQAVREGRFASVRYLCSAEALSYVQRSMQRVGAGGAVVVGPLPAGCR